MLLDVGGGDDGVFRAGIRWKNCIRIYSATEVFEYTNSIRIKVRRNRFFLKKRKSDLFRYKSDFLKFKSDFFKIHIRLFTKNSCFLMYVFIKKHGFLHSRAASECLIITAIRTVNK